MSDSLQPALVCFAVKEEAKFFLPGLSSNECVTLIAGMGQKNAAEGIRKYLASASPRLVITAGFAGGLNPELKAGSVVFDEDADAGLGAKLREAGGRSIRFHCATRVAITAAEKTALRQQTGADAVEMESAVIRSLCREKGIPSATVRVISDAADENLPLDFNALMTADYRIDFARLVGKVLLSPGKIPALMRFQKQTQMAARALAAVLRRSLGVGRG
jgi:adenosylhomocysteine nucleosidase